MVEVIEHLDEPRLAAFERVLFEFARPPTVVVTTPNVEYNVRFETLPGRRSSVIRITGLNGRESSSRNGPTRGRGPLRIRRLVPRHWPARPRSRPAHAEWRSFSLTRRRSRMVLQRRDVIRGKTAARLEFTTQRRQYHVRVSWRNQIARWRCFGCSSCWSAFR